MFDPQVKEALAWAYTANLPAQDTFHEFIQHLTMALCEIGECQSRLTLRPTSTINIKTGAQSNSKAAVYGLMTLWLSTWEAAFVVWYYTNLLDFTWTNHFLGYVQLIYHRLVRGCYETVQGMRMQPIFTYIPCNSSYSDI
jgi:hypothetical protein